MKQHLIFLVVALQLAVYVAANEEDWEKVFGLQGEPMEPKKTRDVLKKLNSYYSSKKGKHAFERKLQIRFLIEAGKVSVNKCNQEPEEEDNSLCESFADYQLNIVPYLKYYRQRQVDLCKLVTEDGDNDDDQEEEVIEVVEEEEEQAEKEPQPVI